MTSVASPRFYVYVLARPDGSPFYVGKGTGDRVFHHDSEARRGCRCHKCNVIRKIWKQGGQVLRYIVFETDDEQEAFAYECELIALYKRETLTNQTDGGEGPTGYRHTPEQRSRRSAIQTAILADPEYRRRMVEARQTPEARERSRQLSIEALSRADVQVKLHDAQAKRWADPAERTKQSERMKGRKRTPEMNARASVAAKARLEDPEYRARLKASKNTPEYRLSLSLRQNNPDYRAKRSEQMKARWEDPEARAKQSAAQRARRERERQDRGK